jgi:hypothetical protein
MTEQKLKFLSTIASWDNVLLYALKIWSIMYYYVQYLHFTDQINELLY